MAISILLLILFILALKWLLCASLAKNKNQPPSPPKLPILGNLHQIYTFPQHSLRSLAAKHGPLMKIYLGNKPAYVASSADLAMEIFKTHDINFSNRKPSKIYKKLLYDAKDLLMAPYSEYWRHMRSICASHLLSVKMVQSFQSVRQEEIDLVVEKIKRAGKVELSVLLSALTNDIISRVAFGRKYSEGKGSEEIKRLFEEFAELLAVFNIGEYVPWLDWINHVNGFYARLDKSFKELDHLYDEIIDDHVNLSKPDGEAGHVDLLDILLEIQNGSKSNGGVVISNDNIKAIVADVFAGGSDTTFAALEWAMAEVIRHPLVMNKVQKEIRGIIGEKQEITKDDLEKMDYLKAIIKEALRLHPSVPLLPRMASKDVVIQGYTIPADTRIMINAMAIGRDPNLWEDADEFRPERFLGSNSLDFSSQDFQMIPFGGGRRGCPGIAFGVALIELVLANLLHKFDWSLPGGAAPESLDVEETEGLSVHMKHPLVLVAMPQFH